MGEQDDTGWVARPGGTGGRNDGGPGCDGASVHVSVRDTGSVRPKRDGCSDGGAMSGVTVDGIWQVTDGGSRPDLCDPADREERIDISPPVKSTLGLEGI